MRHLKVINHLGRTSSHRKSMLANMATSLILHKRITTTTAKAKALRTFIEPLITKSKEDSTHSRRVVFSHLKDKTAVAELFREVSPKIGERPGGYTRILKIGNRLGDNADMCILELVDYNEAMLGIDTAKTKTSRRRRSPKKKDAADTGTKAGKTEDKITEESEEPVAKVKESSDAGTKVAKAENKITEESEEPVAKVEEASEEAVPEEE